MGFQDVGPGTTINVNVSELTAVILHHFCELICLSVEPGFFTFFIVSKFKR